MSTIRKLALILLAAALASGLGLLYWTSRTETGYVLAHPLARYTQLTEADLLAVPLARQRPTEFVALTDLTLIVGRFTAHDLPAGTLLAPAMVLAEPPTLRTFATGKELPEGMRGYPLTLATDLAPVLYDSDLVDLVLINPQTGTATWMLSNVEPLYILADEKSTTATYLLALAPEQVALVEGALADARTDQSGAYAKLVLSQTKNPALPPQTEFNYRDLSDATNPPAGTSQTTP